MKYFLFFLFFLGAVATATAQEVTTLAVVQRDTLYKFVEFTILDGKDTTDIHLFPREWQTREQFVNFAYSTARGEEERAKELARLRRKTTASVTHLAAIIDTLAGAGAYERAKDQELQNAVQGNWAAIIRTTAGNFDVKSLSIAGLELTSGVKKANITLTKTGFRVPKPIFGEILTFEAVDDRLSATGANGTTYILKR